MATTKILVPQLGESVVEATVGQWQKKVGDSVNVGDILVELETDKVDVEVGSESSGVLTRIAQEEGADVAVGDVLGEIDPSGAAMVEKTAVSAPAPPPETASPQPAAGVAATPVARRMADDQGVNLAQVTGSGPGGRITKQDIASHLQQTEIPASEPQPEPQPVAQTAVSEETGRYERIRMSRRRRTIAQRLVEAQQTAAMLTTFNEIDMSAVIDMRKRRQEGFVKRHDIKLGFSSFFIKAAVGALKAFPLLNAEIQGDDILLKHFYDIGMAVGAKEGLVVPVIRNADRKSFAEIEKDVRTLAQKARDSSLSLDDLRGGTFTITNGGVFGSLMSTPILNPPQVGILGLHAIQERPVANNGEVVIRPMMYVALSYDHRIVDGREAVQFLVRVKELVEDPESLLLEG